MDVRTHSRALTLGKLMLELTDYDNAPDTEAVSALCNSHSDVDYLDLEQCASVGVVFEEHFHISPNQACHAGLQNNYDGNDENGALAIVSLIHDNEGCDTVTQTDFLNWLFNDSPYAEVFVDKNAEHSLDRGFIIARTDLPSNLIVGGLIASRRVSEYSWIAKMQCSLMNAGCKPELAYLASHLVNIDLDDRGSQFAYPQVGHTSINIAAMGRVALRNFINHKPTRCNRDFIKCREYTGVDATWNDDSVREDTPFTLGEKVKNLIDYKFDEVKVERIGLNPFSPDPVIDRRAHYSIEVLTEAFMHIHDRLLEVILHD